jgi:GTP-binding protein EngB required for normal cell division
MPTPRPTFPLRLLLAAIIVLLALGALLTLTYATDAALSIIERLERLPPWLSAGVGALAVLIIGAAIWLLWTLFRPARTRKPPRRPVARADVEERLQQLPADAPQRRLLGDELQQLDLRATEEALQVAVFGEISAGKSSLVAALTGAAIPRDVRGGTTRSVSRYEFKLPDGQPVKLADVPGTNEDRAAELAVAAREEALRAHVVLFVVDADLTRDQASELNWLRAFGKPITPVLSKIDRYSEAERAALARKLSERFGEPAVLAAGGGEEEIEVIAADGSRSLRRRQRPLQIDALIARLQQYARRPRAVLESARGAAVLQGVDLRLEAAEREQRREQADLVVREYARRAMLGAMAAVAPGTDLLIQGSLATLLVRRLTALYDVRAAEVDLDDLVGAAGGKLRGGSALVLAIGGNALKAFPGLGTIGGGLVHALAYGMIFTSLGRALVDTLERSGRLDRSAVLSGLERVLDDQSGLKQQAIALLPLLQEAWSEQRSERAAAAEDPKDRA